MKPKTSLRFFHALAGSSLLVVSSVNATQFWDGTGGDANWSTPANWGGDLVAVFNTTAINFGGTNAGGTAVGTTPASQTTANNDLTAGSTIKSIAFGNNGTTGRTQAFTLQGNSILLGTGTNDGISTIALTTGGPIEDVIELNIDFGTAAAANHNRVFNAGTNHHLKIDGVLSGAGNAASVPYAYVMMKQGLGKLTLTNSNNSYLGYTNITGGAVTTGNSVLEITSIANGGQNSCIGASSNAAANLRFSYAVNGSHTNTLRYIGSTDGSTDRSFYLAGNTGTNPTNSAIESSGAGALSFTRSAAIEFSNPGVPRNLYLGGTNTGDNVFNLTLSNNGAGVSTFTKQGVGKWILTNANSYTGATTISDGTLQIGNGSTTGRLTATTSILNNGNLTINRSDVFSQATDLGPGVAITGTGSFTQAGAGTTTLTVANGYTGTTNITGGKLTLGVTDCLANTSNVVIGTGTLEVGAGCTDTVGTLDCTGAAVINLGDSNSKLAFADSSAVDWTDTDPDGSLDITGTFVSGSSLKFGDGTPGTGLNASQLAAITINGAPGSYTLDGSGFLVSGAGPGPLHHFTITPNPIGTTQTVGTAITGITITAKDASEQTVTGFTGTVTFGGTGGFTGTSAIFTLGELSSVSVIPTNAGSNLTFTVNDGSGHTGSTTITTIQSRYQAWAGSAAFTDDANGDGVDNGLAWFLGATGPAVSALDKLPVPSTPTGFLQLDFTRRNPSAPAKLYLEYGNDLSGWTKLEIPAASGTIGGDIVVTVTAGPPDAVQIKIPTATHEVGGKLFARLSANEN